MESVNIIRGYGKVSPSEVQIFTKNPTKPATKKHPSATVAISLALLFALVVLALVGALIHESASESHSSEKDQETPTPAKKTKRTPPAPPSKSSLLANQSAEVLRTVCEVTLHPESCFDSIWPVCKQHGEVPKPDPVIFYNISLQVTVHELRNLSSLPESLIPKANDSKTESALEECMALFNDSASLFDKSLEEMNVGPNEKKVLNELRISNMLTWMSGALSDTETCLDGLREVNSSFVDEVEARAYGAKVCMSNSLAILNHLAGLLDKLGLRMP